MYYSLESFVFGKGQHYIKNARQQSTNTLNFLIDCVRSVNQRDKGR